MEQYNAENQQMLGLILEEYTKSGIKALSKPEILKNSQFKPFGGLISIVKKFGGKDLYQKAVKGLENLLYSD
nr:type I restriction-modification enzyme R subunit C-terminal domain-containing protein [Rodentibacter haemolyticus]